MERRPDVARWLYSPILGRYCEALVWLVWIMRLKGGSLSAGVGLTSPVYDSVVVVNEVCRYPSWF